MGKSDRLESSWLANEVYDHSLGNMQHKNWKDMVEFTACQENTRVPWIHHPAWTGPPYWKKSQWTICFSDGLLYANVERNQKNVERADTRLYGIKTSRILSAPPSLNKNGGDRQKFHFKRLQNLLRWLFMTAHGGSSSAGHWLLCSALLALSRSTLHSD